MPRLASPATFGLALIAAALGIACARTPEEATIREFFDASRLYDRTRLAAFALVVFNPVEDGLVTEFEVVSASAERREPIEAETGHAAAGDAQTAATLSLLGARLRARPEMTARPADELVTKELTIEAPVDLPGGRTVSTTFVVTLQRGIVKGEPPLVGRWIVAAIRRVDPLRPVPDGQTGRATSSGRFPRSAPPA